MRAKAVEDFALQFGVKIAFDDRCILEKSGRFFLVDNDLRPVIRRDFFYAGTFLGKVKGGKFFPSFNLLSMLAEGEANKVVVDKKAAWLFICGRDVFRKGVVGVIGSGKKGKNVLVLNELGECLGFGQIVGNLSRKIRDNEVGVKNVLDVGDFLRRER